MTVYVPQPGPPGPQGPQGPAGSMDEYQHDQNAPASTWVVDHNLSRYPAGVMVFDTAGSEVEGEIVYITEDQIELRFSAPFSGHARIV